VRFVLGPDPTAPADRVGEQQHRLARNRRAGPGGARERECRLERLGAPAERVRQHAVDLRERAVDRAALAAEPIAPRGHETENDDHRLVLREHERRQPIAGPHAVTAADPTLTFDRDPELLERLDVAAHGPRIDVERSRDLSPGRQGARLEELEQLEEPGGGREHAVQ